MEKLIKVIRELVIEEMNNVSEMARPGQVYKVGDKDKFEIFKDLNSSVDVKYKWVKDMMDIVEKAGDKGVSLENLLDTLARQYKHNKTSQEANVFLSPFLKDGLVAVAGTTFAPKEKPEPGGAKGRPASEKTLIAKAVDQKLQADNNYQANEDELEALGAEFIEKLRARVKGTLKRGRPSNPAKAKDGMMKDLKGLMNNMDANSDGEIDDLDDDFEDEDFLQENTLNESFTRMQKIAGIIK
jgi:hypothetical protein